MNSNQNRLQIVKHKKWNKSVPQNFF